MVMCSDIPRGVLILLSNLLCTAKHRPWIPLSSSPRPFSNNVWFHSLMEPKSASLISCRAVMSTFSRESSLSMIAVFLMSSVLSRSPVSMGSIFFFFFSWCRVLRLLFGFCPSSTHPLKQTDVADQHLTDWWLPSLRRTVADQCD